VKPPGKAVRTGEVKTPKEEKETKGPHFHIPLDTPIIISEEGTGRSLTKCTIAQLSKQSQEVIPNWVIDYLMGKEGPLRNSNKISFFLKPLYDTLPDLGDKNRFSALKLLKLKRVSKWLYDQLDFDIPVITSGKHDAPEEHIKLMCKSQLLKPDMDLATIKTFYWKSSADMVLHYYISGLKKKK